MRPPPSFYHLIAVALAFFSAFAIAAAPAPAASLDNRAGNASAAPAPASSFSAACTFENGALSYSFGALRKSHVTVWTSFRDPWDIHEWSYHVGICSDVDAFTAAARFCASGAAPAFQITTGQKQCFRLGAPGRRTGFEALSGGDIGASFRTWGGDGGRGTRVFLRCSTRAAAFRGVSEEQVDGKPVYIFDLRDPLFCPKQCFVSDVAGWWGGSVCGGHGACVAFGASARCECDAGFSGPDCASAAHGKAAPSSPAQNVPVALAEWASGTDFVPGPFVAASCLFCCAYLSWKRRTWGVSRAALLLLLPALLFLDFAAERPLLRARRAPTSAFRQSGQLTAEDAAFAARLDAAVAASPDPFDIAVSAWHAGRTWPWSQGQAGRFFVEPPPASLAMTLEASALAALNATKTVEFSSLMPRCLEGEECGFGSAIKGGVGRAAYKYDVGQQDEFYEEYRRAWKAFTFAKTGADAIRHSQIIGSGVIPIFRGIRALPPTKVFVYPRPLLALFEDERDNTNVRQLAMMRHRILEWGHRHLTAKQSIAYRIRAANYTATFLGLPLITNSKPRVAFIDKSLLPFKMTDFGSLSTLIGLIEYFGSDNVDIFYPPEYIFEGFEVPLGNAQWQFFLYGNGFGFTNVLPPQSDEMRSTSLEVKLGRLHRGEYDFVVWGGITDSLDHFTEPGTVAAYKNKPHRLWLCTNHDIPTFVNNFIRTNNFAPWSSIRENVSFFITQHAIYF
jgi:hypothetical protein